MDSPRANRRPSRTWPGAWLVDVFSHPDYYAQARDVAQALPLPAGLKVAFADPDADDRITALETAGFAHSAVLPGLLAEPPHVQDVWVLTRRD